MGWKSERAVEDALEGEALVKQLFQLSCCIILFTECDRFIIVSLQ